MIEWLRPGWLLALPVGLALLAWGWRVRTGAGLWRRHVDAELLGHLTGRASAWSSRLALALAAATLVLACVALAGPSWRAQPAPLYRDLSARIVVLDLSPSMDAVDVVPSRLERARAAIVALLRESADVQLGLVVFGADAFTVAPLMNDPSALVHLAASLHTDTLPRAGSRPDLGLEMARRLLERARVAAGDVILVGDGAGDERTLAAARRLRGAGFPLSVLGVGAPHGGPVRLASGAFARTEAGDILVARPELEALERVARAGGGRFHLLGAEAPRIARGAQAWAAAPSASASESSVRQDGGIWFVLLALPFAALLFRRGWLAGIAALAIALPPGQARAFEWRDLWLRADQQAAAGFATGRPVGHERLLQKLGPQSPWRALLLYRSGAFAQAALLFAALDTADAHYNRGNALALEGRLEAALAAYGAALERSPSMRDALFNRALVREALARRRAEAQRGGGAERRSLAGAAGMRRESGQIRRGREPQPAPGEQQAGSGSAPGQARSRSDLALMQGPREDAALPERAPDAAELKRLEGLLAGVPDDPGSLLANRFARQLRMRGSWHHDTGGRW
jgi:Ca-activated chloride channel family protein